LFFIKFITLVFIGNNFYFNSVEIVTLTYNLRFNGFDNEWESFKLTEISERITRKNKSLETDRPLTISAQYGLVDQIEFFNKIVASKSLKGYYLLKNGEFAYNKSYSNGYPFGAVKRLDKYENGAISTLYICFKVNDKMNSDLMKEYFETDKWYKEIYKIAVKGARNHGLLNIAVGDFFNTKHILPTNRDEQEKIANFLIEINKKIDLLENKLLNYQNFKKYLMHQIFAQKLRFDFDEEWNNDTIGNNSEVFGRIGFRGYTVDDLVNKGEGALTIGGKHISKDYQLDLSDPEYLSWEKYEESPEIKIYNNDVLLVKTASVGKVCFIENLNEPATLNPQLIVFKNIKLNNKFFYYYLTSNLFQKDIHKIKSTTGIPTITQKELLNLNIIYPSLEEQEKIVNLLSIVDKKIFAIDKNIQDIKEFKKGLLQQMFI